MLSDAELNQMLADAAEIERLREKATEVLGNFTVSEPYGYDAMFCDVMAEGAAIPCIQGCHYTIVELLQAACRSDTSAANCLRLVDEVRRLRHVLQSYVSHPESLPLYYFEYFGGMDESLRQQFARPTVMACHIHGVPVPPHLKPYEENDNVD